MAVTWQHQAIGECFTEAGGKKAAHMVHRFWNSDVMAYAVLPILIDQKLHIGGPKVMTMRASGDRTPTSK